MFGMLIYFSVFVSEGCQMIFPNFYIDTESDGQGETDEVSADTDTTLLTGADTEEGFAIGNGAVDNDVANSSDDTNQQATSGSNSMLELDSETGYSNPVIVDDSIHSTDTATNTEAPFDNDSDIAVMTDTNTDTHAHIETDANADSVSTQPDTECSTGSHRCLDNRCAKDDDSTACGDACVMCDVPDSGIAACVDGQCQMECGALLLCNDSCVNPAINLHHCGACNHDCGDGASCAGGICSEAEMTINPVSAGGGIAIEESGVYFSDGTTIFMCPHGGCKLAPQQIWSEARIRNLVAGAGYLAWEGSSSVGNNAIVLCEIENCNPEIIDSSSRADAVDTPFIAGQRLIHHHDIWVAPEEVADTLECHSLGVDSCKVQDLIRGESPFTASTETLVFYPTYADAPSSLIACELEAPVFVPKTLASHAGVNDLAIYGDVLFMAWKGVVGPSGEKNLVRACTISSGCSDLANYVSPSSVEDIVEIEVNEYGELYWLNGGPNGSVWMCKAPDCTGGPRKIASGQSYPKFLRVYGDNLFWANLGDDTAPAANPYGLKRLTRPL